MPSKILVIGNVNGEFRTVFQKIAALHSKNAFTLALFVGNLFANPQTASDGDEDNVAQLIAGKIDVPLPTYFGLGISSLPQAIVDRLESNEGEICPNLFYLGKRATFKTSEGIRIVALGGQLDPDLAIERSKDKYLPFYSDGDANSLRGANTADILITSEWPSSIRTGSKIEFDGSNEPPSHDAIAQLCTRLKPRYHFSTSPNAFYEREPFFHPADEESPSDAFHITRFLSLASFGNPSKSKWIYAFTLDTTAAPPVALPQGVSSSPLTFVGKKRAPLPQQGDSYRFSNHGGGGDHRPRKRRKNDRHAAGPPDQSQCFFCMSNDTFAGHMVVSIGTETYMTTAKGPLSTKDTFGTLQLPGHMLLIPIAHSATLASIETSSRQATLEELHKYKTALQSLLKSRTEDKFGAVTWEVSRSGGVHTHWQFLPVPNNLVERGLVTAAFKVEAENLEYPPIETRAPDEGERGDYFRVIIWDAKTEQETYVFLPLDDSFRFDLQFGRRVMAKLLGLEDRKDWKECAQSVEDEERDAAAFREAFEAFDPAA